MGKKIKTGHAENLGNFEMLIAICNELGLVYNPSNQEISVANLKLVYEAAKIFHDAYIVELERASLEKQKRKVLFVKMVKVAKKSLAFLESTGASEESKGKMRGWVRKITGSNVRVKRLANGKKDPAHKSNSHLSYVEKADTFDWMIEFYKLEPFYAPNIPELTIVSMEALLNDANASNSNIDKADAKVLAKREPRDKCLYGENGMVDLAQKCKKYVASIFGHRAEETRSMTKLYFRRMVKIRG